MQKDYYIGLDIGTDSLGWAVTDKEYRIEKFKGNAMWGIRLFDESKTAEERRSFRTARRRLNRRRNRLDWLEMIFSEEINKIDPEFFIRLKESNLHIEDKNVVGKYALFTGEYTDKDFHKQFPTVYSLRRSLLESKGNFDVRLVFLALHHIIKYRGHFLFEDLSVKELDNFELVYNGVIQYCLDNYEDIDLTTGNIHAVEEIIRNRSLSKTAKKEALVKIYNITKAQTQLFACLGLLSGRTEKLKDIFKDESLSEAEKTSISFSEGYTDNEAVYADILGERFELIEKLKAVYDWGLLADIRQGESYISVAKDKTYNKHRTDLELLKKYVKTYFSQEIYNEIFKKSSKGLKNYVAYSGHVKSGKKTGILQEGATQAEFCAYLKKTLGKVQGEGYEAMFCEIDSGIFCPKQRTADNGVIPMQLHRLELTKILENAREYLPFLTLQDENGITNEQKIIDIFDYKIPYYVGPLNNHSGKYWIKRTDGKIYPWSIKNIVDYDACAEEFVKNLTNKCTYLPQYDVLAKNTILYSKYMVLNEINNLKLDGEPVSVELKQEIFEQLFLKRNKVTHKAICNFLLSKGIDFTTITGIDEEIKSNMKSYRDFEKFDKLTAEEKDDIITAITVFGDEKKLLKTRLCRKYGDKLTDTEIGQIAKLKYSGWGRLSREFLTQVYGTDKSTGELINIITALWQTNENLMKLIYSENFDFENVIKTACETEKPSSLREAVEQLYVSPKIKRPIYQALLVVKELVKIRGAAPEKIFLEVARYEGEKKRTISRRKQLEEIYRSCKKEYADVYAQLCSIKEDDRLRSDKLFLYFAQCGKCMYTGEAIDLAELMSSNSRWDIDHIYPRSKIKDDSIHNNRVLVNKTYNSNVKGNRYPLPSDTQKKMHTFWKYLLDNKLITSEKYNRLICRSPLTDEQLSAFISRQLVETQQSTKAVAEILHQLYPKTEIVYVKAGLVSEFRRDNDFTKSRDVNDLHHAKDAYLNIVVGNVYNVQCTHNRINFIKGLQSDSRDSFSLNAMYSFDIKGAWDKTASMATVKKYMAKNNILYTRYSYKQKGGLFDRQIVKKGSGQVPIKAGSKFDDTEKYGRYNKPTSCQFCLVEFTDSKKGNKVRAILPVDLYKIKTFEQNPEEYISEAYSLNGVKVIIPCIKYNSCVEVNGFRMHLSKKSNGGTTLGYKPAVQLILGADKEAYVKSIAKYLAEKSDRKVSEFDRLTAEENIELYDCIADKLQNSIFKNNFDAVRKCIIEGRDTFVKLPVELQCRVLSEIIKILHANVMSGDLTPIGGAKSSGNVTTNSKISEIKNIKSFKLINQSATGLYEHEIDLLNI